MSAFDTKTRSPSPRRVDRPTPATKQKPAEVRTRRRRFAWRVGLGGLVLGAAVGAGAVLLALAFGTPGPGRLGHLAAAGGEDEPGAESRHAHDDHDDHDDQHHGEGTAIELSEQARKNIGLTLATVTPRDFVRTIAVPGVVVERPGRTLVTVSSPLSGMVEQVVPLRGEAVDPAATLFELRLTDEDLIDRQSELLRAVEELAVVESELARLEEISASGAIAGRSLLERQYQKQSIEAAIRAQRQALVLHGLSDGQVEQIAANRQLLAKLAVAAPPAMPNGSEGRRFQVVELPVRPGDHVETGAPLAVLADYGELYVKGKAFERDAPALHRTAREGTAVAVLVEGDGGGKEEVPSLDILYVENEVDRQSRALRFFVVLPNEVVRDHETSDGRHFLAWRFKPGQRVEVAVPVERWEDRFVLPVEAVVQEGADAFVFEEIGDHFVRHEVHVEYRDQRSVILSRDGTLHAGDVVAARGAYQIHLALKQQAGGGQVDHHHHH